MNEKQVIDLHRKPPPDDRKRWQKRNGAGNRHYQRRFNWEESLIVSKFCSKRPATSKHTRPYPRAPQRPNFAAIQPRLPVQHGRSIPCYNTAVLTLFPRLPAGSDPRPATTPRKPVLIHAIISIVMGVASCFLLGCRRRGQRRRQRPF
jgi:hypothetical protein